MKKIVVIGSLSIDFIVTTVRRPEKGETVQGDSFVTRFGGKGANQAVAAARLGASVSMMGSVGNDQFGSDILKNLKENQIDVSAIKKSFKESGTAHITLADHDNSIIYIPGANNDQEIDLSENSPLASQLMDSDIVVLQNEIPQVENEKIIEFCFKNNLKIIYNPAPAREIDRKILEKISYITPNETECREIFNRDYLEVLPEYPNQLIVTIGEEGVAYHDGTKIVIIPAYPVEPMDTTGAGDTFNGAFTVALVNNLSLNQAIAFGNLAAALSVQKFGAQGGMPYIEELKENVAYEETWCFE